MIAVSLDRPWLTARLAAPMQVLSWAPHRPGFVTTDTFAWREVRDADLGVDFDAIGWFARQMQETGRADAVGFLTSRDVGKYRLEQACSGRINATCCATVGLSNAERVGTRLPQPPAPVGTINLLVACDAPLSDTGLIEALSIATQARTAAVIDHGPDLPTGRATGTGTDCIAVASPQAGQQGATDYAGLHTAIGEAIGAAVYRAVAAGAREWMETESSP